VINLTAAEGAVIVVRGGPGTGKRAILDKSALLLDRSDTFAARAIDEWDLFAKTFQKAAQRGRSATHPVWVIDDIDEKALVYSDYATAMLDSASFPPGSVVMSVRSSDIRGGVAEFLTRLRKARGDKYSDIDTEPLNADSAGYRSSLRYALDALDGAPSTPRDAPPKKLARQLLAGVNAEERQILEFLSVARFSLPLDVVMNVFSESRRATCAAILDLAKLGCLTLNYRPMPGKDTATLFLRVTDAELRRLIYDCIHAKRRRKLHRTVALLAEQQEGFPKYFLLFHCLESRDTTLSATCAVAYLSETKRGKRHPSVVSLCAELAAGDDLDTLPFAMRILANHELAIDLLAAGRGDEAEALLKQSLDLIEEAEEDQILKMAPRLSETFRLLADRWESRGDFKRALELLEWARDDLQSALPIPDQAQLLNDIGWLLYRLGDYSRSLECCRMSLNTLSANQYPLIVSQALNLMGVVHFNTSRYDEAISYYEQSAVLRERAGDKNALAASYNNLALAYQSKGEFEKAFDHHNKSLKLKMHQCIRKTNRALPRGISTSRFCISKPAISVRQSRSAARVSRSARSSATPSLPRITIRRSVTSRSRAATSTKRSTTIRSRGGSLISARRSMRRWAR
jgi:tetratricopeptide (TPR) repeat protein